MYMLDTIHAKWDVVYAVARKHKTGKVFSFGSCARKEDGLTETLTCLSSFNPEPPCLIMSACGTK